MVVGKEDKKNTIKKLGETRGDENTEKGEKLILDKEWDIVEEGRGD
jgi:hypothetical protein